MNLLFHFAISIGHKQYLFQWESVSRTLSSQTLFICAFYIETRYECDNALQNLKFVPASFF